MLIISIVLVGCGGHGGDVAPAVPSNPPTVIAPPIMPIMSEDVSHIKYGEITTVNGWEASIDTVDFVENVVISNGWNVEVTYE